MPTELASSWVATDVGTPTMLKPSSATRRPSSRMVYFTVEPVPRPTFIPSTMYEQAATPASCLSDSTSIGAHHGSPSMDFRSRQREAGMSEAFRPSTSRRGTMGQAASKASIAVALVVLLFISTLPVDVAPSKEEFSTTVHHATPIGQSTKLTV